MKTKKEQNKAGKNVKKFIPLPRYIFQGKPSKKPFRKSPFIAGDPSDPYSYKESNYMNNDVNDSPAQRFAKFKENLLDLLRHDPLSLVVGIAIITTVINLVFRFYLFLETLS